MRLPATLALVFLSAVGCAAADTRPFVSAGGFIYVSAISGTTGGTSGDIKNQTAAALTELSSRLKAAGSSLENACLVNIYLRHSGDFAAMGDVYKTYFAKDPPARVTVMVDGLPDRDGLIEISAIAVPAGAERKILKPDGWSTASLPYSYGAQSGNTVFLAGLISRNGVDNTAVRGDIAAQTNYIMGNARAILQQAGMTLNDVAQSRVYITDAANFQAMNTAYRSAFTSDLPARATVKTGLTGPEYLVEVAMIAVKDPARAAFNPPGPDGKPAASPNYSTAIRAGNRLFVSGLTGVNSGSSSDARVQTTAAIANLKRALEAAGFSLSDTVEGMVYVANPDKFVEVDAAYRDGLASSLPAVTEVGTPLMAAGAEAEFSLVLQK